MFRDIWVHLSYSKRLVSTSRADPGWGGGESQVLSSIDFLTIMFSKNDIGLW